MAFSDRGFEFLLDLSLCLTQHVLDDALSALRVIACGVASFPATILSFADVALAVCSSLWHARYSAFVPNARSLLTPDMGIDRSYLSSAEPWRDESRDEMLRMTLRVNGKPDYTLVLPADEEYLDAVKAYLDIDVFADAMLCDIRFKVPYIGELIRDTDCPAVEDYNDFAEALEDIWQKDGMLLTYAAVLEAEKPETLHRACELLQDLDNYQRITEDAYGYGQQRLQETLGLDDEAIYELDGYMDFEKYGQDCMENDCVTKTEFGLLRRLEPPFPEQTQGQQMFQ